jgi:Ras of Complex, Roc, domain of DAPkinase
MGCAASQPVKDGGDADADADFPDARVRVQKHDPMDKRGVSGVFAPPVAVTLKVLVIGSSAVGKTSLVHRFVHQKFSHHYRATLGADFGTKRVTVSWTDQQALRQDVEQKGPEVSVVTMQLWDTCVALAPLPPLSFSVLSFSSGFGLVCGDTLVVYF